MATTSLRPIAAAEPAGRSPVPAQAVVTTSLWQSPLVPIALAGTAGIVLDHYFNLSLVLTLGAAAAVLICWAVAARRGQIGISLIYLWASVVALAAAYHHYCREVYADDDIGRFASMEPRPVLVRGVLESEPAVVWQVHNNPLRSFERSDSIRFVLRAQQMKQQGEWQQVSGLAQVTVAGLAPDAAAECLKSRPMHIGDEVEIVGRLLAPQRPANPGESDYESFLQDHRIRAVVSVQKTLNGMIRRAELWPWSIRGWLAVIRGSGQRTLEQFISPERQGLAVALLLGEGSTMTGEDWEKYIKTGVIHGLAISGLHLVILAGFIWTVLRLMGVRRHYGAWFIALFVLTYALMTGGRPPVMRAAVTVCACCGGILLKRPTLACNSFALAWIVITLLNPTDMFTPGFQLSFLSVSILYWGVSRWTSAPVDPLDRLEHESRPAWVRSLRWLGRRVRLSYQATWIIWCAILPFVIARYNLISMTALVIGPPALFLITMALLSGFSLLVLAQVCWPLAMACAWITDVSLAGCQALVHASAELPFAYKYLGDVPSWWLCVFYLGLLAFLVLEHLQRRWRWGLLIGLAWICVGLASAALHRPPQEFRCTFIAVGHGGCTVIETPDGRTFLYDAGAIGGPDVTRRQIAPFLWNRGIRRIDEVLLSHADLDHFNGLPALLDRFAVGQVTCTPTFDKKTTAGVKLTLDILKRHHIPMRTVHAGNRLSAGEVQIDVLHPPAVGPEGSENARSMVLLVRHQSKSILLTGDLEEPGLARVLGLPAMHVDVLQAPHHGSRVSNIPALAAWARPRVVVSCQEPPRRTGLAKEPYTERGAAYLPTWRHGAVTLRSQEDVLLVETYLTRQRWLINR